MHRTLVAQEQEALQQVNQDSHLREADMYVYAIQTGKTISVNKCFHSLDNSNINHITLRVVLNKDKAAQEALQL